MLCKTALLFFRLARGVAFGNRMFEGRRVNPTGLSYQSREFSNSAVVWFPN